MFVLGCFMVCILFFRTSEEVLHTLGNILGCLQRGRTSLIVPRKRTIDDLMKSRNMVIIYLFSSCNQLIIHEYIYIYLKFIYIIYIGVLTNCVPMCLNIFFF